MRFYGMSNKEVMKLPIHQFWTFNSYIPRLKAEEDIRALTIAANAQSAEGYREIRENLVIEMGEVAKVDPIQSATRDEDATQKLRALMA